ncbi:hypothetical protein [Celeribacter neptunius]|uniref:Flagellar FliJ protein n=1 Tax=Celeribacter neptunius TaxID=588602 RepID=A0A1I3SU86_9RHOB|nr:hypothetical protein [Celeribacter neptunius]SFJ61409.1 hypothetical protein SAMN04487991_2568 [Celeribacter neptunius]
MTKRFAQLKRLQEVAELALNSELAKLADIKREEEGPRARLRQIEEARAERAAALSAADGFDMASLMGVDRAWDKWADQEKRQALRDLARVAERREAQLELTRKAFGKKDALSRLAERDH